jgi:uncharacterized integral membrane protein
LLALIIAVVIIVFTAQNQTEITLTFINWELSKPLPVMLAVPFFVGAIAVKKHKKKIHELEEKLLHISEEVKTEEPETEPVEREISQDSTKDQF